MYILEVGKIGWRMATMKTTIHFYLIFLVILFYLFIFVHFFVHIYKMNQMHVTYEVINVYTPINSHWLIPKHFISRTPLTENVSLKYTLRF